MIWVNIDHGHHKRFHYDVTIHTGIIIGGQVNAKR